VESAARQALAELRRVVGLLDEASGAPLQPPPSLGRLPELATQLQAAGVPLDLRVDADPSSLPPGLALAAYRIIQEAGPPR
jgi:signal transduction histidine kinase